MSKKVFIAEQETLLEVQEQVEKLVRNLVPDDAPIYGMVIHEASDLNPSTRVEYLGANKDFTPMSMNMSTHAMNYGSWADWDWLKANVPVMCNWDGGIDYFLDPDDYTKKADGTNSDAANIDYAGDAMAIVKKIYKKVCSIIEKYNLTAYDQQKQTTAESWYRVRKNWSDAKSQIGAYHSLEYAKTCVDKNPGYSVFDEAGVNVYPENVFAPYMVRVKISDLKMRLGATIDTASVGHIPVGSYTIVEEKYGKVSKSGEEGLWGRIKSEQPYNGKYVPVWICLSYTEKV